MSDIKNLIKQRQTIWAQAKAILDAAESENRDLSAEEQGSYDKMTGDLTSLRARIDRMAERAQNDQDIAESLRSLGIGSTDGQPGGADLTEQFRDLAKRRVSEVNISARDFGKALESRALAKGAAATGGATVPTVFYDRLVEHMIESSGLMQLNPTVINTTGGETLQVPVTTSYGAAALTAEAAAIAGTDPAFAQRSLGAYKYGQLVLVARELIEDSAFDLAGFIAKVAGRNVGMALGAHLVTGTGTGQPTGVITSATTGVTGATAVTGAFSADNLIDLMFSVTAPYRNSSSAGWLVKDSTLGAIRKLKDGAGRYLFEPAAIVGQPDSFLGKPIQTDPNVAAVGLAAKSVAFGDFSAYFVRMAGGVRFERSDDFKFDTDQVAFRAVIRADGVTADQTGAIKLFVGAAT
jgi:HK97 family phage major capsid protein